MSILGSLISLRYGVDPGLGEEPRPTLLGTEKKKMLICLQWEITSNAIQSMYKLSGMLQLHCDWSALEDMIQIWLLLGGGREHANNNQSLRRSEHTDYLSVRRINQAWSLWSCE